MRFVRLDGDFRVRISSIDPSYLDSELIDVLASEQKICPHFHLSLQSGNTLILKRMKRRYTAEQMYERIGELSKRIPHAVYGADVLAGFPTESEQASADSVTMIERLGIAFPACLQLFRSTRAYRRNAYLTRFLTRTQTTHPAIN